MDSLLDLNRPVLAFHCPSTAPHRGATWPNLSGYVNSLIQPNGISRLIICTEDKQDKAPLTDCSARISNCEGIIMSRTFYTFNLCGRLLWYLNYILVHGTLILISNIEDGCYAVIKTIQGLGWQLILANHPSSRLASRTALPTTRRGWISRRLFPT